jgi:hypothetical protein
LRMKRPCLTPPPAVPIDYEHEDIKYPVTWVILGVNG